MQRVSAEPVALGLAGGRAGGEDGSMADSPADRAPAVDVRPEPNANKPGADGERPGPGIREGVPDQRAARHRVLEERPLPSLDGDDYGTFFEDLLLAQRKAPRKASRVPRLVLEAAGLVWRTNRLQTSAIIGVQVLTAGLSALVVLLGGFAVRELLKINVASDVDRLLLPLLLLAAVTTFSGLAGSGSSQFGRLLGEQVQRKVSSQLLDVTTEVDLVTYDDADFHDQLNRVLINVPTRPFQVVTCLASLIGGVAGFLALIVTLFVIQPVLVPILLVGGVPLWFLSRKGSRLEFNFAVAQTASMRERDYLQHTLSRREDAAELRAYNTAGPLRGRWDDLYDTYLIALRRQVRRRYVLAILTGVAGGVVLMGTLLVLVALVHSGSVDLSQAAAAAVAIRLLSTRIQQMISGLTTLFESALFLEDFDRFLTRRPAKAISPPETAPSEFRQLRAEGVAFRYPHATADAIHGIDVELRPGEIVALVGENGSGKTTLAKVLAGLYEPRAGQILLNGERIAEEEAHRLRDNVALVLQDFTHYAFSATQNIAFGRPEVDPDLERVVESARRVGADSFLRQLPDGYETRLSKVFRGGRELSLGQWQRVALARAFYRDAPIVILDEPTAALDPRAEAQLYDSVRSVLAGRTVLLITHRLASVRGADRIVVLDRGSVVEQGDHEALMRNGGLYEELVSLQRSRHIGSAGPLDVGDLAQGD